MSNSKGKDAGVLFIIGSEEALPVLCVKCAR